MSSKACIVLQICEQQAGPSRSCPLLMAA